MADYNIDPAEYETAELWHETLNHFTVLCDRLGRNEALVQLSEATLGEKDAESLELLALACAPAASNSVN